MLTEVCQERRIAFSLQVGRSDLRPAALSYYAYLVAISRVVQSTEPRVSAQLTLNDLTSANRGQRMLTEATLPGREGTRMYNRVVRAAPEVPMRGELTSILDQIGRWPVNQRVEGIIPQVRFAKGAQIIKLPLDLRYIVPLEDNVVKRALQARKLTYADWYTSRYVLRTMTGAAIGVLNSPGNYFCLCLELR